VLPSKPGRRLIHHRSKSLAAILEQRPHRGGPPPPGPGTARWCIGVPASPSPPCRRLIGHVSTETTPPGEQYDKRADLIYSDKW